MNFDELNIDLKDEYKRFDYGINCFNRDITLIFKDFDGFSNKELFDNLEYNYYDWQDDDKGYCLEEYMLEQLPELYKNNITSVLYGEYEEEDV